MPDALDAAWRDYYARAREMPAHTDARDFLHHDLKEAFARLIPADASVLEAGCGEGDLLAALPNARRMGIDYLPETIERARARHPDIRFEVGDIAAARVAAGARRGRDVGRRRLRSAVPQRARREGAAASASSASWRRAAAST